MESNHHDFINCLEYSNINLNFLDAFYKEKFPYVDKVLKVTDLSLQKQGIDTTLVLRNGKQIYIDEKKRKTDYGDIFLEDFSIWHKKTPGWLSGVKKTDYIVYIIVPSKRVFFLPFLLLQQTWIKNYEQWLKQFKRKLVPNANYYTTGIPIPFTVLKEGLYKEASWEVDKLPLEEEIKRKSEICLLRFGLLLDQETLSLPPVPLAKAIKEKWEFEVQLGEVIKLFFKRN